MSTPAKARVAALICLVFMVWPAVQRAVVAIYDTNAWQLGGFAMYATPPARTRVSMFEMRGRQKTRFEGDLPSALDEQQRLYTVRRAILGSLLPPDALAEAYFQARPDVDHVEVVITREMLDVSSALIDRREVVYPYDRLKR